MSCNFVTRDRHAEDWPPTRKRTRVHIPGTYGTAPYLGKYAGGCGACGVNGLPGFGYGGGFGPGYGAGFGYGGWGNGAGLGYGGFGYGAGFGYGGWPGYAGFGPCGVNTYYPPQLKNGGCKLREYSLPLLHEGCK